MHYDMPQKNSRSEALLEVQSARNLDTILHPRKAL